MDERLEAGRHHLANGERALQQGYPDDARGFFTAALLQFRGPELRLGEAHALRGLAQVAVGTGETSEAERLVREAVGAYQGLAAVLDRIDDRGVTNEMRRDGKEGEAAALVLLGDVLVRQGRNTEAREALSYAREIYAGLERVPSAAGVWNALGRLAIREGRYVDAGQALSRSMDIHAESGDLSGQVGVLLSRAELARLQVDLQGAERCLHEALPLARGAHNPMLEGRVLAALGAVLLQGSRLDDARKAYQDALPLVRRAGDLEMEAFALLGLGDVESRLGEGFAIDQLFEGARILGTLSHVHGLAGAMHRIGEHALRFGEPSLALIASEASRRLWKETDPERGVGMALRVVVKSLAALKEWEVVLMAAMCRAQVAGSIQPNALAVADFYKARAPKDVVERLVAMETAALLDATQARIADIVYPELSEVGMLPEALDTLFGALEVVSARIERLPRPSPPDDWDELAALDRPTFAPGEPEPLDRERPPTDEVPIPRQRLPEAPPHASPEISAPMMVEGQAEEKTPEGYAGLYTPPADLPEAGEDSTEADTVDEDTADEDTVEDDSVDVEIPEVLRGGAPDGYDYTSPFEEEE